MAKILLAILFMGSLLAFFSVPDASGANPKVLLKTNKGDITIELYADKAPVTVKNFLSYVDQKFYDATIFHRVIKGFMIQGGGLTADYQEKASKPPIKNEAGNGLKNAKGTIAMARADEIDSATCQFYINHDDNFDLDHVPNDPERYGYAVFGQVVAGFEVVDAIAKVRTGTISGYANAPRETIIILSIRRVEK